MFRSWWRRSGAIKSKKEIGANAFAIFTKNQRQWVAKPPEASTIRRFKEQCQRLGFSADYILPHDST